jgi:very-short-patch-repair endonuclease
MRQPTSEVNEIDGVIGGQTQTEPVDRSISRLAERQHGVVSRSQLRKLGMGADAIDNRVKVGRLHVLYRGVYAVGHRVLTLHGRWMAGVIASGRSAVISHRAAAALWEIRPWTGVEVTVTHARRPRRGIRLHYLPLRPDEVTTRRRIPVTTVPRTLLDLATVLRLEQLERIANEAEIQRHADCLSLADLVERHPRRHGIERARALVASLGAGETVHRSELETRFREFLRARLLPPPVANDRVLGIECDCVWREQRVIVELDGRAVHRTALAFERDRERDRLLQAAGWRVVRITWKQLTRDGDVVARDLRSILGMNTP